MALRILATDLHILNMRTRMPFRYGIATLTALPHLFVRLQLEVNGESQWGIAADGLPPKWFTKDPSTSFEDDLNDMFDVIRSACAVAKRTNATDTVFDLWHTIYTAQGDWGRRQGYPALLWQFGASLVERALIDGYCRVVGTTFAQIVRENRLGIRLGDIHPELDERAPSEFLPKQPLRRLAVRHTVGLGDPLTDDEIGPDQQLDDGLPQSLSASIRAYGLTHFKIKIAGDPDSDLPRLHRLAQVIQHQCPAHVFTLDGNEQFRSMAAFRHYWETLLADPVLGPFLDHLLFVEQPLHRDVALAPAVGLAFDSWPDRPPIIIDESDGELENVRQALALGYVGASHKNCKGVFKGIANACLIRQRQMASPAQKYIFSGEDLANVGPVALLQDCAVLATLGIGQAERNGHHYFCGLRMLPQPVQQQMLDAHGDLYQTHHLPQTSFPTLSIVNGTIQLDSVVTAPFGIGYGFEPSAYVASLTPLDAWRYDSL